MKKRIISIIATALWILMPLMTYAQDSRQRNVTTIVQDALAQMPAENVSAFGDAMSDLAKSAPSSVVILVSMMQVSEKAANNTVEYAIDGLVNYVTAAENANYADAVREGLVAGLDMAPDAVAKAFLLSKLQAIATDAEIPALCTYLDDKDLSDIAVNVLSTLKGGAVPVMDMIKTSKGDKGVLAYAASSMKLKESEPYLLAWAPSAEGNDRKAIISALASIGTKASVPTVRAASAYEYSRLLLNLAEAGDTKTALAGAKALSKEKSSALRCASLDIIMAVKGDKAAKDLLAALASKDKEYRNTALEYAESIADRSFCSKAAAKYKSLDASGREDILNFFGRVKADSQADLVIDAMDEKGNVGKAAVKAAGLIGGDKAVAALISRLGDPEKSADAMTALNSFKGNLAQAVKAGLEPSAGTSPDGLVSLMQLASAKRMKGVSGLVFGYTGSTDAKIADAAYSALSGVVAGDDTARLAEMLDNAPASRVTALQKAFNASVENLDGGARYATVTDKMRTASNKERFYACLAYAGTDQAVANLTAAYEDGSAEALKALMKTDNYKAADILLKAGAENEAALMRFVSLVNTKETNIDRKCIKLSTALDEAKSLNARRTIFRSLAAAPTMKSFLLASKYLDDKDLAYDAALAVKTIATKCVDDIDYNTLMPNLLKARTVFAARNSADDGYAVDEIDKKLAESQPSPVFVLSDDEKAQGFELLFDGTDLSKWTGDMEGYTPVNGTIYVTANYGNSSNLYTKKEYRDFIFRFEFCFVRPGVNNGVGIRTPMGKDAAYWGMCESQILDHDDPIYKGLMDYQVHGSVYGVVPARRIVHKPIGEWSTEEIKVVGDRITVTVNGEVIVDTDVRKACQGHNVAPDGSNFNPYTVDHRNHPGMFNEKGHIGFLGHGAGIKFRNVRILSLD